MIRAKTVMSIEELITTVKKVYSNCYNNISIVSWRATEYYYTYSTQTLSYG